MMNLRSGAGFTQKARPDTGSLRNFPINSLSARLSNSERYRARDT